jgi:hypothetical protein
MVKLRCSRKDCGYAWNYSGKSPFYASCPMCRTSVNIKKNQIKDIIPKD